MNRRHFIHTLALAAAAPASAQAAGFQLRHLLASSLYGTLKLAEILPEAAVLGAKYLDLWPLKHGDQREQAAAMGDETFGGLLEDHEMQLGCVTRYDLGPFRLADEMHWAGKFGCRTIVTSAKGPKGLAGAELKAAVAKFAEEMKPHCELAEKRGIQLAIENHANGLLESADAVRWLVELAPSPALGIALAPYHLPQDEPALAALTRDCGRRLFVFYAWQHGKGSAAAQPKADELQQLPGRGPLDFGPLLGALREIAFDGWTSIFMHPFPRGIPIVKGGAKAVTAELLRAKEYLEKKLNG